MEKKSDNLLNEINPLNLACSFNDNVVAFKLILNLCDSTEVRNLGQQILDSFLLLNLLNDNIELKKYYKEFEFLTKKLNIFVNQYSHFQKLLRNNEVKTKVYLSDIPTIRDNVDEFEEAKKAISSENSYIVMYDTKNKQQDYSINKIFNATNLFESILCKDKEGKFKEEINVNRKECRKQNSNVIYSEDCKNVIMRKKKILVETITNDDLDDNQHDLFNKIEKQYCDLLLLEKKLFLLENLIDKMMSRLYVLDPEISKIYRNFKDVCEKDYSDCIKARVKLIEQINVNLSTFEDILNISINQKKEKIDDKVQFNQTIFSLYKNYILYKIQNGNDIIKFSDYLKFFERDKVDIINYIVEKEEEYETLYVDYLIKKLGDNKNEEFYTFDSFLKEETSKNVSVFSRYIA